jgi:hydrogenase maturation protease
MARVAVIGIGNVLTGDDAIGPTVVRTFEAQWTVPEAVEVLDAGTPGLDLTAYIADLEGVIFVDAVKAAGAPGTLRILDKDELLRPSPMLTLSPHQPGVREALLTAEFMGVTPARVRLIGVVPGVLDQGIGLSPAVRAALPAAIAAVVQTLLEWGLAPIAKEQPVSPDVWWEKPADH